MNKTIKTRDVVKDIKVLDKKAAMSGGIREAHAKTKDVAERSEGSTQTHRHGADYAQDKTEQTAKSGAQAAGRNVAKGADRAAHGVKQKVQSVGQKAQEAQKTATRAAVTGRKATTAAAKQATQATNAANKAIKQGSRGAVKTADKSIKTAKATAKTSIKTSQQAARGAKAAAKGTQVAARNAARVARVSAKAAAAAVRLAARAIAAFVKMAIAAVKSLVAAIAAGGWVAVVVILVICLIAFIAVSAFGIFFVGGDMGDGNPSLRQVVAEISQEHQDEIDRIKSENQHDELMISGTRAAWKDVLAVYSVKTTTDIDEPLDAITLDERRQKLLRNVYWDMNLIEFRLEDREFTEIIEVEQDNGTIVEETQTYTRRTLYITQTSKTADEIATQYRFNTSQLGLLAELLDSRYASTWQSVLYDIRTGSGDIVEVAISQLGNPGGAPYWSWYGFSGRVEWCACFVSWCANECGYIQAGIIPRHSYCQTGINWFKDAGCWQDARSGYEPRPGDIIYFDWGDGGDSDHVGIVESCDGATVRTIEGNSGDAVNRRSYSINSSYIIGYGTPMH